MTKTASAKPDGERAEYEVRVSLIDPSGTHGTMARYFAKSWMDGPDYVGDILAHVVKPCLERVLFQLDGERFKTWLNDQEKRIP